MRRLLIFVDSEPAKFSLLAGSSNAEACDNIVWAIALEECATPTWTWLSRVPTESNPAVEPSRLKVTETAVKWGATVWNPQLPSSFIGGRW
eukprot:1262770-Amphidinium_carterae.1